MKHLATVLLLSLALAAGALAEPIPPETAYTLVKKKGDRPQNDPKVNGAVDETRQQNANDLQERTEAIRIYSELVTRLENGEINLEEFERLVAPQEEIIYRPILLTID